MDLVQEVTSRRTYALKRITCHTMHDEEMALKEVEVMKEFHIINLVPLVVHSVMRVGYRSRTMDILSEVLIVMPLYQVCIRNVCCSVLNCSYQYRSLFVQFDVL